MAEFDDHKEKHQSHGRGKAYDIYFSGINKSLRQLKEKNKKITVDNITI